MDVVLGQFDGVTTMRPLPLAAGLLVASARRQPALADARFRILTQRLEPETQAARIGRPAVLGLSLYAWNERYALAVAATVRHTSPRTLVVVGGPSVPRRPEALQAFMAQHGALDAAVLGEGELSFTELLLAAQAGATRAELAHKPIAGTVLRHGGATPALAWGPPRDRLAGEAFAATGSPYLDGTFETYIDSGEAGPAQGLACVFETNRGCPFACTFCDWGQATQSRVNELPIERVMAELRWAALRRFPYFYLVDANFGIRRRDPEIVAGMAALHAETGCPAYVHFHLTKNATERNLGNVLALRRAGIATQVALSVQDIDAQVLRAIRRDNIRPERVFALREASHREGLPTSNELLLGLPEQTLASVRSGIVAALTPFPADSFFLYPTRLLPNAELDAPEQHDRHGLVTADVPVLPADPGQAHPVPEFERVVVGTRTLPPAQWLEAFVFAHALAALHNQRLAPCTLHVLVWHLQRDAARFVDALLAAWPPWRQVLGDFADALASGRAGSLPVPALSQRRLDPIEAAVAQVLLAPDAFFAALREAALASAGTGAGARAMIDDAVAFDSAVFARNGDGERVHEAAFDWPAYQAAMGERPVPCRQATPVAIGPVPQLPPDVHHAWFMAAGWSQTARRTVTALAVSGPR